MLMILACCFATVWTSALQRSLDASASWIMERHMPHGTRTLVSSGTVECVSKSGIVWRVTAPFESSVAMTRDAMIFRDEDGERIKSLSDLPHYADIRDRTDAFAAGDHHAFDGLFALEAREFGKGGWQIVLTPQVSDMKRLFIGIEVSGNAYPTNALLRYEGGGSAVIRFYGR